jgi:hypothetical protein
METHAARAIHRRNTKNHRCLVPPRPVASHPRPPSWFIGRAHSGAASSFLSIWRDVVHACRCDVPIVAGDGWVPIPLTLPMAIYDYVAYVRSDA